MVDLPRFVTLEDYEAAAHEVLSPDVYDYYAGGAGDERTVSNNATAFDRWVLRPRMLRGASSPDTSTVILGTEVSFPVLVAPWAYQWMAHPDGEMGTRRAASDAGTVMVVSSTAEGQLEELATAATGPVWWQVYVSTDRVFSADMIARVEAAGYGALVWTVDFPVVGLRHRDTRSGFVMPIGPPGGAWEFDPAISWDDLGWMRDHAGPLPILVKGILTAEDAVLAVEHGADAIVVSNHGGRQLDASIGTLDALPEVVEAVVGRVPVLVDGGVRHGTDVVMALALGAAAVLIGRPTCWGLAVAGQQGVAGVLRILREEIANVMAQCGAKTVREIGPELIAPAPYTPRS